MLQFDEYKVKLNNILPALEKLADALDLESAERELDMLQAESAADGFWDNLAKAQKVQQRIKTLQDKVDKQARRRGQWDDLMALCEMGYVKDACNRMMSRYYNLATNENSTLWEDFYILGTKNHAWTGCPLEIAFRYILGLSTKDNFKTYTLHPVPGIFEKIDATFPSGGKTIEIHLTD